MIKQEVRKLFLSGCKCTAHEINERIGFNDARKVISTLRTEGWDIQDTKLDDGRKLYWLEDDQRQTKINW